MKYVIVSESNTIETTLMFEQAVNEKIEAGYRPLGGIAAIYSPEETRVTFYQAMFKEQ